MRLCRLAVRGTSSSPLALTDRALPPSSRFSLVLFQRNCIRLLLFPPWVIFSFLKPRTPLTLGRASHSLRYYDVTVPSLTPFVPRTIRAFFILPSLRYFLTHPCLLFILFVAEASTIYFSINHYRSATGESSFVRSFSRPERHNDLSDRIPIEHLLSIIRYRRSCLPSEIQRRPGVVLQKLIVLAVARSFFLLFHATNVRLLLVRLRVLHTKIHRFLLFRPEGSKEGQTFVVRGLHRFSSRASVALGDFAVNLATFPTLLTLLRRRRGRTRAHALARRTRQAGYHLRWADLIHVRYDEALLEREERRIQQLHVCERRMKQRWPSPHRKSRNFWPEQFVRTP